MDPTFLALLKNQRRQEIIRTKGNPKYPKAPPPKYPKLAEIRYSTALQRIMAAYTSIPVSWARTQYQAALDAYRGDEWGYHADEDAHTIVLSLTDPMLRAQEAMALDAPGSVVDPSAAAAAESVNEWVAKRYAMERKIALGTVYDIQEPWVQGILSEWTTTNRKLVKSMTSGTFSRVETLVTDAVVTGKRPEALLVEILKIQKTTAAHARLIARDQIGKLTASLSEKRSLDMGVENYTWQTAMDERVRGNPAGRYPKARPSHWGAQGKIGVYGNPGIWLDPETLEPVPRGDADPTAAPGQEIQCRCTGASRLEDLLKPIDEELLTDPWVLAEMGKAPWPV